MATTMMSERDVRLIEIRPQLTLPQNGTLQSEQFQNTTLRPILKFQNGIILAQFKKYLAKFKPTFNAYNQSAQRNYIEDVLKTDPKIKNSLIASVVSMMTLDEYEFYCTNKIDANKRIVQMLTQRLKDHLEYLY
jgi:NAD-specific glutamate dehydrogenase